MAGWLYLLLNFSNSKFYEKSKKGYLVDKMVHLKIPLDGFLTSFIISKSHKSLPFRDPTVGSLKSRKKCNVSDVKR